MRKALVALSAGIIGMGAAVSPATAQDLPAAEETAVATPGDEGSSGLSSLSSAGSSAGGSAENEGVIVAALAAIGVTGAAAAGVVWAVQQGLIPNPLPGIIPGPAPSPAQPAPTPAPAPTPVLYNCSFEEAEVRPDLILLYCADAHSILDEITWYSWDINGASGRALLKERTCVPSCATGGYTARWVNFTLGGMEWHNGQPQFTRAYVEGREYCID